MAIIDMGILGAFRGKCGPVIGYIRNGVACVRSMPAFYHDRKSAAQLKNRSRFTMVMKMMSVVRPVIALGFRKFASDITEMNVATRVNYYSLVKAKEEGFVYDFSGLVLSRGSVEGLSCLMKSRVGKTLLLAWDGDSVLGGMDDRVSVALVNGSRMALRFFHREATRRDSMVSVPVPEGWEYDEVGCYVMVERGQDWSESVYLGDVTPNEAENKRFEDQNESFPTFDQSAVKLLFASPQFRVQEGFSSPSKGAFSSPETSVPEPGGSREAPQAHSEP